MRKRTIVEDSGAAAQTAAHWWDLESVAQVEISSEDAAYPIESALIPGRGGEPGWRAGRPGEQTIRLLFDVPRQLRRIQLLFDERQESRTQEFVLRWSPDGGRTYREILRQQFNFSPPVTAREVEDYGVCLDDVTAFELRIIPDISGGGARASLAQLRLS